VSGASGTPVSGRTGGEAVPENMLDRLESIERELSRHYDDIMHANNASGKDSDYSFGVRYHLADAIAHVRNVIRCLR
jgi:hypothetical protein